MVGRLCKLVPAALVAMFIAVHFSMTFSQMQLIRHDPSARHAIPTFVAGFYTFSLEVGHVLELGLIMTAIACTLAVWRRTPLQREDLKTLAEQIGYSHIPLLAWVCFAALYWVPLTMNLARAGLSPGEMAKDTRWLDAAAMIYVSRTAAGAIATAMLAFLVARKYSLGLKGAVTVVVLPAVCVASLGVLIISLLS
jgi:hypothetical protein